MHYKKRLKIFLWILVGLFIGDAFKFFVFGDLAIINWHSYVHLFWVVLAILLLFANVQYDKQRLWSFSFYFYFVIFFLSYLNQYLSYTSVLTYNCMLFNGLFAVLYMIFNGSGD